MKYKNARKNRIFITFFTIVALAIFIGKIIFPFDDINKSAEKKVNIDPISKRKDEFKDSVSIAKIKNRTEQSSNKDFKNFLIEDNFESYFQTLIKDKKFMEAAEAVVSKSYDLLLEAGDQPLPEDSIKQYEFLEFYMTEYPELLENSNLAKESFIAAMNTKNVDFGKKMMAEILKNPDSETSCYMVYFRILDGSDDIQKSFQDLEKCNLESDLGKTTYIDFIMYHKRPTSKKFEELHNIFLRKFPGINAKK